MFLSHKEKERRGKEKERRGGGDSRALCVILEEKQDKCWKNFDFFLHRESL
jgi:hypothetical protein